MAAGTGDDDGEVIVERAPVSTGSQAYVTEAGDYRFFAGWRSDPFFFDALGALSQNFTGTDFFGDKDVCSIALEIPNAELGSRPTGIWARTLLSDAGQWVQVDRGARPQQEPFLAGDDKAAYLAGEPVNDARFIPAFAHSMEHLGGRTPEDAARAARTLLPDILIYDAKRPAAFPGNGRSLTDDVVDVLFPIFTNGKVTTDNVGPHTDLLTEFPYVGPPHKDWSAELVAAHQSATPRIDFKRA